MIFSRETIKRNCCNNFFKEYSVFGYLFYPKNNQIFHLSLLLRKKEIKAIYIYIYFETKQKEEKKRAI